MPLLVRDKDADRRELQCSDDPAVLAWFGTLAEIVSALARLKREGRLPEEIEARARDRLNQITQRWAEVAPTDDGRDDAFCILANENCLQATDLPLIFFKPAGKSRKIKGLWHTI